MKNNIGNRVLTLMLLLILISGTACKKMFDIKPQDQVDASNAYLTLADADAAVFGIYGKFMKLSDKYIILNELRADLMDVTANADPFLKEINNHSVSSENPYANPKQFYDLILDCNDALAGLNKMVNESRISVEEYERRYSDIGSLRSWLYLQVGIHYGNVPYITVPLKNVDDIQAMASYPKTSFGDLVDSLINFTTNLKYNRSEIFTYPTGNTLNVTFDGNASKKFYITRPILLGDLYLWKGEYLKAASNYKIAMDVESTGLDLNFAYRVAYDGNTIVNTVAFNGVDARGREQDTRLLYLGSTTGWRSMFAFPNTNRSWNAEWYWALPYSVQYKTKNPLPNLFSVQYGSYLLKPSQAIIDSWNSQFQSYGSPGDPRGMMSYTKENGVPEITKFTDNSSALFGGGQWNIWRAASVHLHYAEAANRDNKGLLAFALLNQGIKNTFSPKTYTGDPNLEQLALQITPYSEPYYFDARDAGQTNNSIRQLWSKNIGIRGRGFVRPLDESLKNDMIGLEDALINENSLELAFEGQRWSDLLRIAMRRDDASFLAEKVYQKLLKANNPSADAVRAKLLAKDWYLPFDIYK